MSNRYPFEKTIDDLIDEISESLSSISQDPKISKNSIFGFKNKTKGDSVYPENSIDELRLFVKYILFDLDATRRENRYLKKLLDEERS